MRMAMPPNALPFSSELYYSMQLREGHMCLDTGSTRHMFRLLLSRRQHSIGLFASPAHYSDIIMGAMASQITSLTSVYSAVYSGTDQRNIKAPRHWPLYGEFTGNRLIPRTKDK